jgi:hypothetical protein
MEYGPALRKEQEAHMSRTSVASSHPTYRTRGLTAAMLLVVAAAALMFSLVRTNSAEAHCDSMTGPVVTAAQAALDANDVALILPYVKADSEAELTAAFEQTMAARALGEDAQVVADRYFFETAVRLHRSGEGAPYTGLKKTAEHDPALEAAEGALGNGSLTEVYDALDLSIQAGVEERYQAVLDAREREASEGTLEATRERVEAELQFETYVHSISLAAGAPTGHDTGDSHSGSQDGATSPDQH